MNTDLPVLNINTLINKLNVETKKILEINDYGTTIEDEYVEKEYNLDKLLEKNIFNSPWNLGGTEPILKILKCPYFSYNSSEDILIIDIKNLTIFLPLASEYPACTIKIINQHINSENCFRTKMNNIDNVNCIIENYRTDNIVDTEEIAIFTIKNTFYHIISNGSVWQFITTSGIGPNATRAPPWTR